MENPFLNVLFKNSFSLGIIFFFNRIFHVLKNYRKKVIIGNHSYLKNVRFEGNNTIFDNCRITKTVIGNRTYISSNARITNCEIGRFCSIAKDVVIGLSKHPVNEFISSHPFIYKKYTANNSSYNFQENEKIIIGNDVWIGEGAIIYGNITIGDGAIIAAGALVNKNVKSFSIVGGVPASEIKKRFDQTTIEKITKMKWYSWDEKKIIREINEFRL